MPNLNNTYRISNPIPVETQIKNDFGINCVNFFDFASTMFKEEGEIYMINKQEIQKIRSFQELENDWDSYGAITISPKAIEESIQLVNEIGSFDEDVDFASPGPNGEVLLQLRKRNKEIELIIYDTDYKYVTFEGNNFVRQGSLSKDRLPILVRWLNQINEERR